jgi:HK97 family phage major capsid protein
MKQIDELNGKLAAKSQELNEFLASKKVEGQFKMTAADVEAVQAKNKELNELGAELDGVQLAVKTEENLKRQRQNDRTVTNGLGDGNEEQPRSNKSVGELFVSSSAYKAHKGNFTNPQFSVELEHANLKTTMTTAAGFAPANDRTDIVVPYANRRPVLASYIPQSMTALSAIKYMEETTFTNNAAAAAENAALAESATAFTERTVPIELIGTYIPITEQQLEDEEGMQSLLNQRLTLMLDLKEESELLSGSGTTPRITGFYNKSGIQTQAKGADPVPDAIFKGITKVRSIGFADPTLVAMHPNDWQDIRLLTTTDGLYIWGHPSEAGVDRIWGVQVLSTTACTENTALVGDFALYSHISRKRGARIDIGLINDDLVKNKLTAKITSRMCLEIYRAAAFCTVTGI